MLDVSLGPQNQKKRNIRRFPERPLGAEGSHHLIQTIRGRGAGGNAPLPAAGPFFPNRSFTSKGSSGGQEGGLQKTPNPVAGQVGRTLGGEVAVQIFEKN